jgi:flagellar hook-basal body complex protein FliE
MTIAAVSGVTALPGVTSTPGVTAPTGTSGGGFGNVLADAVDNLSGLQNTADSAAIKAVTSGDLTDIHQATLAATRAQVTMELVTAVRNKGIDAFNQIMSMQA